MKYIKPLLFILISLSLIVLMAISPLVLAFGKTGKSTKILNKDYSLLGKTEIEGRLASDFPLPESLILTNNNRQFSLNLSSISAQVNTHQVASNLLYRRLNQGLQKYFEAFFVPKNFTLEINYQSDVLDSYVVQTSSQIDKPFIPSELYLDSKTGTVMVKNGEIGQKTNTSEFKNIIIASLQNYQVSTPIEIPIEPVGSLPQVDEISQSILTASRLIGKSLELSAPDQSLVLDDKTLISWVNFNQNCRQDRVKDYVIGLKTSLKKDPVEAVFKFENNKVLEFQPSQNGYVLDDIQVEQQICQQINSLIQNNEKSAKQTLAVTIQEPQTTNSDVNNMGIKELLGRGKSTFKHSSDIRNFNVSKGSSIVNRVLVAPGDTFSFIKNLGEVTLENGYKKAYIIRAGKTELDVGGGICQVSTTLFRAMLDAGLDITDRHPHAYRVGYYEEDSPPGYDATVFIPNPDLKFINDTGHHLLIQSTYDDKNKTLVYEIYGTSDGRKTEISNYRQWDYTQPPPDVNIDDPTLPVGKTVQDEHRIAGLKTAFDWKVTKGGEVIHQKTFQSSYVPWAAVFRHGTKTN